MPKRGYNIYQRKDGRWEGRYIKGRKHGKIWYGYVFGKTQEETLEKLKSIMPSEQKSDSEEMAFKTVACDWFNTQKVLIKTSSVAKYSNILNLYLLPIYGQQSICTISRNDVTSFSRTLLVSGGVKGNGLSPKTVNSILSVLKNIFKYAEREKMLMVADIRDINVKQPQKPMRILSYNEQGRLTRYLYDNLTPCHLGILLCLFTGLRIGEICALKWGDIFLSEKYIYVHHTMQRIQTNNSSGRKTEIVIMPPKSDCSIRQIPIPADILKLLLLNKKQDDAYLLTGKAQKYIEPRSMENHFKAVTEKCCITGVNFHALRHTFATRCVELGFDIKSLSEILGHASVSITLNRYVHPSMELKQKNMDMLSGFLPQK